jgi:hypothetical protein
LSLSGNLDSNSNPIVINAGQTVEGIGNDSQNIEASGSRGEVVRYRTSDNTIFVKVKNNNVFKANEQLFLSLQSQESGSLEDNTVVVSAAGAIKVNPDFSFGQLVTGINPSDPTKTYDNLINGTVRIWDVPSQTLTLENDKQPINSDYASTNESGSFIRTQQVADQSADIFRIGDLVSWSNLDAGDEKYYEIKTMEFSEGVDFVSEDSAKDTSSVAKYVTKEISLTQGATAIDVIITANVTNSENIQLAYKTKTTSIQKKFEDIEWQFFNGTGFEDTPKLATPQNTISAQKEEQSAYQEFRFSIDNLDEFTSFGVKISMKTDDPSYVPKVQDIRVVSST